MDDSTPDKLKPILQWVGLSGTKTEEVKILHQYEEDKTRNIKEILDLAENNELDALITIPINQRIDSGEPVGNPFIAVDLENGMFNVNGTNWYIMPDGIDPFSVNFRPIWYHTVVNDLAADTMDVLGKKITKYKIGWQFTYEGNNYQRILFYDTQTGIISLKEKR